MWTTVLINYLCHKYVNFPALSSNIVHVFCTYFSIHLEPIGHKIPGVGLWLAQGAMWSGCFVYALASTIFTFTASFSMQSMLVRWLTAMFSSIVQYEESIAWTKPNKWLAHKALWFHWWETTLTLVNGKLCILIILANYTIVISVVGDHYYIS